MCCALVLDFDESEFYWVVWRALFALTFMVPLRASDAFETQVILIIPTLWTFLMEKMAHGTPPSSASHATGSVQRRYHLRAWLCLLAVKVRVLCVVHLISESIGTIYVRFSPVC